MAYGVVRLTLYALITAIEADLRDAIISNLLVEKTAKELLAPEMYQRAHDRMERDGISESDAKIIEYLDFTESIEMLWSSRSNLDSPLVNALKKLVQSAPQLAPIRNRVMHARPLEYDDFACVSALSKELLSFPPTLFRTLRQTEQCIKADPAYVFSLSFEDWGSGAAGTSHNLPIPDFDETGFLGRSDEEPNLLRICRASPWPVITVLGEGGVGKTALALKVAYTLLDDKDAKFDAVIWSTSKTTKLTVSDVQKLTEQFRTRLGYFKTSQDRY